VIGCHYPVKIQVIKPGAVDMQEKERTCIFCGERQEMVSYICAACQDRIQRDAMKRNIEDKKRAEKALKKHGVDSEK